MLSKVVLLVSRQQVQGSFSSKKAFKLGWMGPESDVRDSFYQREVLRLPHVLCVVKKRNECSGSTDDPESG